MKSPRTFASLACLALSLAGTIGCAEPAEEVDASEDELRRLDTSEMTGEISSDGMYRAIVAPPGALGGARNRPTYQALRFQAHAGERLTAHVLTDGRIGDTLAYILADDFRTLARNDDFDTTGSSKVSFRASRSGTYYLAFRMKEGSPNRFLVRLHPTTAVSSWRDSWPTQDGAGRAWPPASGYPMTLTTTKAFVESNGSGCRWVEQDGPLRTDTVSCKLDHAASKITCTLPFSRLGAATMDVAEDGLFSVGAPARDDAIVYGRVYPGGLVTVGDLATRSCSRVVDNRAVFDAASFKELVGLVSIPP